VKLRAAVVLVVFVVVGCGDDGSGAVSTDGSSGTASAGTGSTTQSDPPGTSTTNDVTGDGNGTGIASGSASEGSEAGTATSTGGPSSGSADDSGSGAAGTGSDDVTESSGTSDELGPYGDCQNLGLPCPAGSFCLLVPQTGVCTPEGCRDAADCPEPPPGGTALVTCLDANADGLDDCRIDCSQGEQCPTGMECFSDEICVWSPS
jgi:hypothetical protein